MAGLGLQDTIDALNREDEQILDALAAKARLASVNPVRRLELATAEEKNPDFVADSEAIRKLRGDNIVLAAGGGVQ
jgi:predicted flavoprotein YhiN